MSNNKNQQSVLSLEETLSKEESFFLKYRKAIIIGVVAVVAIVAGVILFDTYYTVPREQKASTALAKGQELFAGEQFEKALNGDGANYAGFLKVADEFSGTDAANLPKLYAGLSYAKLGKWQEAATWIEKFDGANDQMVSPAALGALGNVYAHLNQLDKAVENLKKAASKADNNSLSPLFLVQAGEILESQGKQAEALELYKQVKSKYFNSIQYQTIDKYIERATK